eukprot:6483933-Amphidinium_carterae.2
MRGWGGVNDVVAQPGGGGVAESGFLNTHDVHLVGTHYPSKMEQFRGVVEGNLTVGGLAKREGIEGD